MLWNLWWPPDNKRLPVLIVNGFTLVPFYGLPTRRTRNAYRKLGHRVHKIPWSLESMMDITQYSEAISNEVINILRGTGKKKVNLIGWSLGGVACLHAIKRSGLHCLVDSLITFSAPFHGADLSYTAIMSGVYIKTGIQAVPNSQFLQDLMSDPLPGDCKYVSISGERDRICPANSAILPGAENIRTGYSHKDFLYSSNLHKIIASHLRQ